MSEKKEDVIAVRLSRTETEELAEIKNMENISSNSEIVRMALEEYMDIHKPLLKGKKIVINIPEVYFITIENLIDSGLANSIDDVINQSLKLWIENEVTMLGKKLEEINQFILKAKALKNGIIDANKNFKE